VEIERIGLWDAIGIVSQHIAGLTFLVDQFVEGPVDLVGGRIDHDGAFGREPCGLQHVERAQGVDLNVPAWLFYRRRDRDLSGQMDDHVGFVSRRGQQGRIAYVPLHEAKGILSIGGRQPLQIGLGPTSGQVVVQCDLLPPLQQAEGVVRADEAGTASDQILHE